jgi:hypothetical protein
MTRALDLTRHRHAEPPFAIDLPAGVEVADAPGVLLIARDPGPGGAFRANLTVAAPEPLAATELSAYVSTALEQAAETFSGWWLVDRTATRIGDLEAERTLGCYLLPIGGEEAINVALEQWWLLAGGRAWCVSGSCEAGEFPLGHEAWERCAESLRIGGER